MSENHEPSEHDEVVEQEPPKPQYTPAFGSKIAEPLLAVWCEAGLEPQGLTPQGGLRQIGHAAYLVERLRHEAFHFGGLKTPSGPTEGLQVIAEEFEADIMNAHLKVVAPAAAAVYGHDATGEGVVELYGRVPSLEELSAFFVVLDATSRFVINSQLAQRAAQEMAQQAQARAAVNEIRRPARPGELRRLH